MSDREAFESLLDVNARANRLQGVGSWRALYRRVIERLPVRSVLEVGSGDPAFLANLPGELRRLALDGNPGLAPLYEAAGIEFHAFDFDREASPVPLSGFDVAVCSDVFEHLLYPQRTLELLAQAVSPRGILLSHVPNEFRLLRSARILLGLSDSVVFHPGCEEWNNPHLRRFTDAGYRRFLALAFGHSVKLNDLHYSRVPRLLDRLGLRVPYFLEGGPTYASTNDPGSFRQLLDVKRALAREHTTFL